LNEKHFKDIMFKFMRIDKSTGIERPGAKPSGKSKE